MSASENRKVQLLPIKAPSDYSGSARVDAYRMYRVQNALSGERRL